MRAPRASPVRWLATVTLIAAVVTAVQPKPARDGDVSLDIISSQREQPIPPLNPCFFCERVFPDRAPSWRSADPATPDEWTDDEEEQQVLEEQT